jgi:hypothetical protein
MRQFTTSTVEQRREFTSGFGTHPMETAWASEAIFFITVEDIQGESPVLKARIQISADGVNWVDEGTSFDPIKRKGHYFIRVTHFGGWLRVWGDIEGPDSAFNLTIHLALKE